MKRRFEKRGDGYARDLALRLAVHDGREVQEPGGRRPGIAASPDGIELSVVPPVEVQAGLEMVAVVHEVDAAELPQAVEARLVAVVRALEREEAHVLELHPARISAIDLGNGYERSDSESIVEEDGGVVGKTLQPVERGGDGNGFASARMPHEGHALEVHLSLDRVVLRPVPLAPLFQVLEEQPRAQRHFLPAKISGPGAVHEVLVHRDGSEPAAREKLSQVRVTRVGVLLHPVVAVNHEYQGKRAASPREPYSSVDGCLLQGEAPVPFARPGAESLPFRKELRRVERPRSPVGFLSELRASEVRAAAIREALDFVVALLSGIREAREPGGAGVCVLPLRRDRGRAPRSRDQPMARTSTARAARTRPHRRARSAPRRVALRQEQPRDRGVVEKVWQAKEVLGRPRR